MVLFACVEIIEQLELDMDEFIDYWDGLENITIIHRLGKIIDRVLERCDESIVIFIDEIDSILGIDIFSADDFFAVIRTFYNLRSEDIRYNRLSFAIFGVARAEDLMRDASRTPFNIAHAIKLTQLSLKESMPLLDGLTNQTIPPKEILQKVFDYTSGTPYLTQKILSRIASHPIEQLEDIDTIVHQLFIQDGFKESNISNIQQRIVGDTSYNVKMLHLVAQMIEGRCLANESDNAQIYLKLSGVAKSENGFLVYNNAIYQTLFNKPWLEETLAKIDRPFAKDLNRWVELQYDKSALLRGEVLKKAKEWAENRDDLSHNENAYLRKSIENEAQRDRIKTLWLSSIIILIVSIGLVYYYFENREYKVKLDNTASGIDNRLSILKNATKDDREYQNYTIPTHIDEVVEIDEELLKHYGIVDRALVKSHSAIVQILFNTIEFNYSEKVSWFNTLPSMSDTQKEEFFKILQTKAKQDYRKIGNQFALDGQYAQALTAYQKAIEINPKDDKAYYNMGIAYFNLKKYDKAVTAYQKAIEINPKDAKVYHSMGVAYAYLNEYDKALTAFQKAIEINPKNDSTYILMGISYGVLNEYDKALTAFQKAVAINPKFDYPYIYMGNAYRNLKEYDKALTAYPVLLK
ncbi:MAG: hypothetical protein KU28_12390 [Sulfurovum sp. PC08-66]|nr:MAG: hypothetical protein KU28_12390 [Sulfurovum sp. PC08-66]